MSWFRIEESNTLGKLVTKHIRARKPDAAYMDVIANIKSDPDFKSTFGSPIAHYKRILRGYFEREYNLEEKVLRYVPFNITPGGRHTSNQNECLTETIKECVAPEDVDFLLSIVPKANQYKESFVSQNAERLYIPEEYSQKHTKRSLEKLFFNLHTGHMSLKRDPFAFHKRLSHFYFAVGKQVKDTKIAADFITKNFYLIGTPMPELLPDQKEITCPNKAEIAENLRAVAKYLPRKSAKKIDYLNMAQAFEEGSIYTPFVRKITNHKSFKDNESSESIDTEMESKLQIAGKMIENLPLEFRGQVLAKCLNRKNDEMLESIKMVCTLNGLFPDEFQQLKDTFTP